MSSGSSYLNRVELQSGCLSLGHSNLFIPSTLAGVCTDPDTGATNEELLRKNLNLAITAYINRVDGCPCGDTTIRLYRGADSSECHQVRDKLFTFLKGSRKQRRHYNRSILRYMQNSRVCGMFENITWFMNFQTSTFLCSCGALSWIAHTLYAKGENQVSFPHGTQEDHP